MLRKISVSLAACLALATGGSVAHAQVGDPSGTFNIKIKQGGNTIVDHNVTIGPGGDLMDLRPTYADGDPEDFTQIGSIGAAREQSPVILKVVSDQSSNEAFRVTHWYIDAPVSLNDIYSPGPTSLFDPNGGDIDVTITGLGFSNGVAAIPMLLPTPNYYTSFMRDIQGHFYESSGANAYNQFGNGLIDVQVPGSEYLDGDLSHYTFDVHQTGTTTSWTWGHITNPGLLTKVNNGLGSTIDPLSAGYVFELGLSMAFVAVPEPATLGMLAIGAIPMLMRKRRR